MKVAAYKEHFIRRHYGLTLNGDYKMKKFTLSSLLAFTFFGLASCGSEETTSSATPSTTQASTPSTSSSPSADELIENVQDEAANMVEQAEDMLAESVVAAEARMNEAMEQAENTG